MMAQVCEGRDHTKRPSWALVHAWVCGCGITMVRSLRKKTLGDIMSPVLGHVKTLECRTHELLQAAADGDSARLAALISFEPAIVHATQWTPRRLVPSIGRHWPAYGAQPGCCAIHCAAQGGHRAAAQLLVDRGADAFARTRHDLTPLHLAAFAGSAAVVQLLLRQLEPPARTRHGEELDRAASDIFGVRGPTALHFACCAASEDETGSCIALLLGAGASVHAIDESSGRTALHYAVAAGHVAACTQLVAAGAWLQVADRGGATPLMLARRRHAQGEVGAASLLRELRWLPSVRLLWLGYCPSDGEHCPSPNALGQGGPAASTAGAHAAVSHAQGEEKAAGWTAAATAAVAEEAEEATVEAAEVEGAKRPLRRLTHDALRLVAAAIIDSHRPPPEPPACCTPTPTPPEAPPATGREGVTEDEVEGKTPAPACAVELEEEASYAELALAVRTLHEAVI